MTDPSPLFAAAWCCGLAAVQIVDRYAPRPETDMTPNPANAAAPDEVAGLTRRAVAVLMLLAGLFAAHLAGGCAPAGHPLPPVDDRLGSMKELNDEQNKAVDAAATSNADTLTYIRQARDYVRRLLPNAQ